MTPRDIYNVPALYDAEFGGYRADQPFYAAVLNRCPGTWLEPGCGTGRLYFQHRDEAAHRYVGLDASATMLKAFVARARGAPGAAVPRLVAGSMGSLPLGADTAGVCTLAYNVVHHLMEPSALRAALAEAARVARWVALDVFMPPLAGMERWDAGFDAGEVRVGRDGTRWTVRERTRLDRATRVQETVLRFEDLRGGRVEQLVFTRRLWEPQDLLWAAEAAGLAREWLWGDVFGEPWEPRSPRLMGLWQRSGR